MRFSSVRLRLTLWNVGVLALILVVLGTALRYTVQANLMNSVDRDLRSRIRYTFSRARWEQNEQGQWEWHFRGRGGRGRKPQPENKQPSAAGTPASAGTPATPNTSAASPPPGAPARPPDSGPPSWLRPRALNLRGNPSLPDSRSLPGMPPPPLFPHRGTRHSPWLMWTRHRCGYFLFLCDAMR